MRLEAVTSCLNYYPSLVSYRSLAFALLGSALLASASCRPMNKEGEPAAAPKEAPAPILGANCAAPDATAGIDVPEAQRRFNPITLDDLISKKYEGKTLFLGVSQERNDCTSCERDFQLEEPKDVLLAGDPVTLCVFEPDDIQTTRGDEKADHKSSSSVVVKTAAGERRVVSARTLSTTPLAYSLRKPGKASDFVKNLFLDGHRSGIAIAEQQKSSDYALDDLVKNGSDWKENEVFHQGKAYKKHLEELVDHLRYMTSGGYGRESLMSAPMFSWLVNAEDTTLIDWYSEGPKDKKVPAYEQMLKCVQSVDGMSDHGYELYSLRQEMKEKRWRENVLNASPVQLEKLDKKEMSDREKQLADRQRIITEAAGNPDCKAALTYAIGNSSK